jgi:methionyl-tRNA formyltransferase
MQQLPPPLKFAFFGYGDNGFTSLSALLAKDLKPHLVIHISQNSQQLAELATAHQITTFVFNKLEKTILEAELNKIKLDLICIASFPYLIPQSIINLPKFGVLNVHTAALPKYRGYHPINWALIKDEPTVGVTLHYVDHGMDTGDIIDQTTIAVTNADDINTLKRRLNDAGAVLLVKAVDRINRSRKKLVGREQADSQATFAPKRSAADGKVKWSNNTRDIFNLIRALKDPYPNAFSITSSGDTVLIKATLLHSQPGTVLAQLNHGYYVVTTGDGIIAIKTDKSLTVGDVLK